MRVRSALAFLTSGLLCVLPAAAFERDVHLGLTEWLAVKAGYSASEALLIAIGNQRVDSGDMQFVKLSAIYACGQTDVSESRDVQARHFPSGAASGADNRSVTPGSKAAYVLFEQLLKTASGKESQFLAKLGEAMHPVQDSWAHQGIPETVRNDGQCNASLTWAHPASRGGADAHKADHTHLWPVDSALMAKATYEMLLSYRQQGSWKGTAARWEELDTDLRGFILAKTKAEKRAWFVAHGISDTAFLSGITLPAGGDAQDRAWNQDRLPALLSAKSDQHGMDPALLDFFGSFLADWLSTDDLEATIRRFAPGLAGPRQADARTQLLGQLRLWRIHDHGQVQELAHSARPLTSRQLRLIAANGGWRNKTAPEKLAESLVPLLPGGEQASPLLPFFVVKGPTGAGPPRAMAVLKLKSLPYDVIQVHAQWRGGAWNVSAISASIEH